MAVSSIEPSRMFRLVGLAADAKPTTVPAGSTFLALDTGIEYVFDGTTWYTVKSSRKTSVALLPSASRTTTQVSADIPTYGLKGLHAVLNMTVVGTGSVTLTIEGKDANGLYYSLLSGAAVITNVLNVYKIFRGAPVTANVSANDILPTTIRITVTANNANAATYSLSYELFDD